MFLESIGKGKPITNSDFLIFLNLDLHKKNSQISAVPTFQQQKEGY